jgi:DNA adenine methylase
MQEEQEIIRPFFRWAGGKQNLVKVLIEHVPEDIGQRNYYEPFLGAGSLYFAISPKRAILSDSNNELINTYNVVKKWPNEFVNNLKSFGTKISKHQYKLVRHSFNNAKERDSIIQAVRFVLLIQTSFNGIYRVNQQGLFNVPFGRSKPNFPSLEQILAINKKLKNATLRCKDYQDVFNNVEKGDFIYFDPPYPPLNGTSSFHHYTRTRFSPDEQEKLANLAQRLSKKGVLILISNADIPRIRLLYKGWNIKKVEATRFVSCKSQRKKVSELLIKNY